MVKVFQTELGDVACFGYGHPGLTKTSLTESVANDYNKDLMIAKMICGRFEKDDFALPEDPANLFFTVMQKANDADYQDTTWSIDKMVATFLGTGTGRIFPNVFQKDSKRVTA